MKEKSQSSRTLSRRKFIQGVGSGVIGSSVLLKSLQAGQVGASGAEAGQERLSFVVNGKQVTVLVPPDATLAEVLREHLHLTGTKIVCNHGECGACTVLLDGEAVYSCHMLALEAEGKEVVTIEGLLDGEELHPIQKAFVDHDGLQCGFCTPGQIMATQALLMKNPRPSREEILEGMSGNLCRCAAYPKILESVVAAAEQTAKQPNRKP